MEAHRRVRGDRLAVMGGSRGGEAVTAAAIPVERIQGPVLLASGGTPEANASARADAWLRARQFLSQHLAG
jgi:hypothetical protein